MVHSAGICQYVMPGRSLNAEFLFRHAAQEFLRMENLVTAPECLYLREHIVQRLCTSSHRICKIQHPCVRAVRLYLTGKSLVYRHSPHRTQHTAGSYRIAYRLVNAVLFRQMHITRHFVEGAGKYGANNEIRSVKCASDIVVNSVIPF